VNDKDGLGSLAYWTLGSTLRESCGACAIHLLNLSATGPCGFLAEHDPAGMIATHLESSGSSRGPTMSSRYRTKPSVNDKDGLGLLAYWTLARLAESRAHCVLVLLGAAECRRPPPPPPPVWRPDSEGQKSPRSASPATMATVALSVSMTKNKGQQEPPIPEERVLPN
jgi:hypothetical protein